MKLDLDLMRKILLTIEEKAVFGTYLSLKDLTDDPAEHPKYAYHVMLLLDDDLIVTAQAPLLGLGYPDYPIERLTMKGHNFLNNIRDDTVWRKVKDVLIKVGSTASLDIIKTVASRIVADLTKI
ncbi:MAG: DUF2513 domain-containing protein [Negativicutes bacterium]|nr:DUF2513 domain-containing protein [Negativicutes bacterium]